MNHILNYRLHRFDGCSKENLIDASVQLVQISASDSLSISIGSLRPTNFWGRNQYNL